MLTNETTPMNEAASTSSALAMKAVGALSIVLGGLVAAVTSPLALNLGSWAAAYLVLVAGVAQYAMGEARLRWRHVQRERSGWLQLAFWLAGNAGVIAGTIIAAPALVFAASALLVAALVLAFLATMERGTQAQLREVPGSISRASALSLLGYRALLVMLSASVPVGLVLSVVRNT